MIPVSWADEAPCERLANDVDEGLSATGDGDAI